MKLTKMYSSSLGKNIKSHYDIIISGGGIVGFAMACSLAKKPQLGNKKILLLESAKPKLYDATNYNLRVSALNGHTKTFLQSVGAWKYIENARFSPVRRMQVWDSCSGAAISFGNNNSTEDIAYIVENDLIQNSLMQEVDQLEENVDVAYQTKVSGYELPLDADGPAKVILENGTQLSTSLIIGADGFNSGLRKAMKAQYITYDYHQMAVVATLRLSEAAENETAWQRFLPTGPIALLPLNKELSSLVWSTDKDTAKSLLAMPPQMFIDRVNEALWDDSDKISAMSDVNDRVRQLLKACRINFLDEERTTYRPLPPSVLETEGDRGAFPLGFGHAVDYVSDRSVLIGDAAHRVHPLAGQGVNLGFGDVTELTFVISEAISNGVDYGNQSVLKQYQAARQLHNLSIMTAVHGLHLLYNTSWMPIVMLRSVGLNFVDAFPTIKKLIRNRVSS